VEHWAALEPLAAAEWSKSLTDAERPTALAVTARAWASIHPIDALEWALSLGTGEDRWNLAYEAFRAWWEHPEEGQRVNAPQTWLLGWEAESAAIALFSLAGEKLSASEALTWASEISHSANRIAVLEQAFYHFGKKSPAEGISTLTSIRQQDERAAAIQALGLGWMASGEKGAFDAWVSSLEKDTDDFYQAKLAEIDLIAAICREIATKLALRLPANTDRDPLIGLYPAINQ
jgi:hypothetical protein